MGVKLIIKGADFSQNGIKGTTIEYLDAGHRYRKVDYIESQGGADGSYIDTGYKYTSGDFCLEAKAYLDELVDNRYLCGSQTTQGARSPGVGYYGSSEDGWYFSEGNSAIYSGLLLAGKNVNLIDIALNSSNNGLTVTGTSSGSELPSKTFAGNVQTNKNIFVMAKNGGNGVEAQFKGRLYKFKLTVGSNDVLDLVPCYDESSGTYGVYNAVNGAFLSSASSTPFTGGMDSVN